jgi:hypothetical protein
MGTAERIIGSLLFRSLGALLLGAVVVSLVHPFPPNIPYRQPWVVAAFAVLLVAVVVGVPARPRLVRWRLVRWLRRSGLAMSLLVSLVGAAVSAVLALNLVYPVGWDAGLVQSLSTRLSLGTEVSSFYYGYLSLYSNNIPFLAVAVACTNLARSWGWDAVTVFVFLNALCLLITTQAVYAVVRMLRGPLMAIGAQLTTLFLLGLSPWLAVPYTDALSMPWPVLGVALALAAGRAHSWQRRAAGTVGAAAVLAIGSALKTTPVITVIAIVAVAVLVSLSMAQQPRRLVTGAAGLALFLGLFLGGDVWLRDAAYPASGIDPGRVDTSQTPPPVWWAAMGTTIRPGPPPRYGGYDASLVVAIRGMDRERVADFSRTLFFDRVERMGALGYARFAATKHAWNWGDGMFWAWGEGPDARAVVPVHGPLTPAVASWNHPAGRHYAQRAAVAQAAWLLVLAMAGMGLLLRPYRRDLALLVLTVLGIAIFTVVFQGRSRYVLVFVPVVVALAHASLSRPSRRRGSLATADTTLQGMRSADPAGPELDGDARADGLGRLGNAVVPRALARATHDDDVAVAEREADGRAPSARPEHQRTR